ncbi:hypothetical protein KFE25_001592 [Diacronema lutheri]|uniref:EF-hand domain-containing protein n=1 Tax=Diacronema lutheri TaxID=2081491 RepID=A0A8J6C7I7_DIALT|nr:hypothetical protein KFE25_001592 [Diacronema lutheri]
MRSAATVAVFALGCAHGASPVVRTSSPTGLPVGSAATFALAGTDLSPLAPAALIACRFSRRDGAGVHAATAKAVSPVRVDCAVPAAAGVGEYVLDLVFDGVVASAYFAPVVVWLYDAAAVSIARLEPGGGPTSGGTSVTLSGTGFASYGAGQLCCAFDGARACSVSAALLADDADGSRRLACAVPPRPAGTAMSVEVTLNGALDSPPLTSSNRVFRYYAQPTLDAVSPTAGPAVGGLDLTVTGSGLDALLALVGPGGAASARLRVGDVVLDEPPLRLNESAAVFAAPHGSAHAGARSVALALNGVDFASARAGAAPLAVSYSGFHAPRLVSARFADDLRALVLGFGDQPTDRAGMSGLGTCAALLDDATARALAGDDDDDDNDASVGCYWRDDTTLIAQLGVGTSLRAGSTVTLRAGAVLPAGCAAPGAGGCAGLGATGSALIPRDAPCVGVCERPQARLNGPALLSACADEGLRLDAAESTGGGAFGLRFEWRVDEARTDGGAALNARLATADAAVPLLRLNGTELGGAGARAWLFLLRGTNLFGEASDVLEWRVERAPDGTFTPTLAIDGARQLEVAPSNALLLQGRASAASCWQAQRALAGESTSVRISFEWEHESTALRAGGGALSGAAAAEASLPLGRSDRSTLLLPPLSLRPEYIYTLRLRATMGGDARAAASARVEVAVRAQPVQPVLAGGDRRVPRDLPLRVDASRSYDPNVPAAVGSGAALAYEWSVTRTRDAAGAPIGAGSAEALVSLGGDSGGGDGGGGDGGGGGAAVSLTESALLVPAGTLEAGTYSVSVTVSQPRDPANRTSSAAVDVEVVDAPTASVSIKALPAVKYNARWERPTERFTLDARLDGPLGAEPGWAYRWRAFELVRGSPVAAPIDLDSALVSTTGGSARNLALVSGALTPGTAYRFEMMASGPRSVGLPAFAAVRIEMNRPPYGGALTVAPSTGEAASTSFALLARGWVDEPDDLPVEYAFAYARVDFAHIPLPLSDRQRSSALDAFLPAGELVVLVTAFDAFGASASASAQLNVTEPDGGLSDGALHSALRRADELVDEGNAAAGVQLLLALADLRLAANSSVVAARRRLQFGGDGGGGGGGDDGSEAGGGGGVRSEATVSAMLATLGRAEAAAASTNTFRTQLSAALAVVLASPDALDGGAQQFASGLVRTLSGGSKESGLDGTSASALLACLDAVLTANASLVANLTERRAMNQELRDSTFALASALLAGAVAGEAGSSQVSGALNISTARADTDAVANSTLAPPGGSGRGGEIGVPSSVFASASTGDASALDDGVDTVAFSIARNPWVDPQGASAADAGVGGIASAAGALGPVMSPILSVTFKSVTLGSELALSGLDEPFTFTLDLSAAARGDAQLSADDDCTDLDFCSGHGSCVARACACVAPYYGARCAQRALCFFFNETERAYSVDGCRTLDTPVDGDPTLLYCACDHLTDFCGIEVPTSAADVVRDATSVRVNTFAASDLAGALAATAELDEAVAENPTVYALVFAAAGGCALSLAACCYKDWREAARRARAAPLAAPRAPPAEPRAAAAADARVVPTCRARVAPAPALGGATAASCGARALPVTAAGAAATGGGGDGRPLERRGEEEEAATLSDKLERGLDALDRAAAARLARAATTVQRQARGASARARAARLALRAREHELGVASRARVTTHALTALLRRVAERLEADHSILGVWFGSAADSRRAELGMTFWNVLMLGLVLECLLYEADDDNDGGSNDGAGVQINLVQAVVTSVIVAALTLPALIVFRTIFALGYARTAPIAERVGAALLATGPLRDTVQRVREHRRRGRTGAPDCAPSAAAHGPSGPPAAAADRFGRVGALALRAKRLAAQARAAALPAARRGGYAARAGEHRLDDETVELLRATFRHFDADGSGFVSIAELRALTRGLGFRFTRAALRSLAAELDSSGEGRISFGELIAWFDAQVQRALDREERWARGWRKCAGGALARCAPPPALRIAAAWTAMAAIFATLALLAITYSRAFGPGTTRSMVLSWGLAEAQALALEEPIAIALTVLVPSCLASVCGEENVLQTTIALVANSCARSLGLSGGS